jgi:uncharacterized protein (TIGR02118 family)
VSSLNPIRGERRVGSIGLRLPYQSMKIARLDERGRWVRDCGTGESGSILIRGPNVFAGYADPAQDAAAFAAPGWLDTGDLGHCDAEGFFWISGRAKDLIKRSGHSVDPRAVEEILRAHPAVAAVAVVGRPDDRAGEVPVAFAVLRTGAGPASPALLEALRSCVTDPIARPVAVVVTEALPVTAVGKVDKAALRTIARLSNDAPQHIPQAVPAIHPPNGADPMIRVTVTYPRQDGASFDHEYYRSTHRALLMERLWTFGLQRVEMDHCLADGAGGPAPAVAAAHMLFSTLQGFQDGMAEHGAELMADVANYTTIAPSIVVSETA